MGGSGGLGSWAIQARIQDGGFPQMGPGEVAPPSLSLLRCMIHFSYKETVTVLMVILGIQ